MYVRRSVLAPSMLYILLWSVNFPGSNPKNICFFAIHSPQSLKFECQPIKTQLCPLVAFSLVVMLYSQYSTVALGIFWNLFRKLTITQVPIHGDGSQFNGSLKICDFWAYLWWEFITSRYWYQFSSKMQKRSNPSEWELPFCNYNFSKTACYGEVKISWIMSADWCCAGIYALL